LHDVAMHAGEHVDFGNGAREALVHS
jgi:hypothetical protein